MKSVILAGILCLLLTSTAKQVDYIPESNQAILTFEEFSSFNRTVAWVPTKEETQLALLKVYNFLSRSQDKSADIGADNGSLKKILSLFSEYKVQFVGVYNKDHSRYIHCNFFIDDRGLFKEWKNDYVLARGGGCRYWRVTVNLENDVPRSIIINGNS